MNQVVSRPVAVVNDLHLRRGHAFLGALAAKTSGPQALHAKYFSAGQYVSVAMPMHSTQQGKMERRLRHLFTVVTGIGLGCYAHSRRYRPQGSRCKATESQRSESERFQEWRGYPVRCVKVGDGSKNLHIVLVHGFGGSIEYWRRLIPALSTEGYTVHAFDLLGLGLSEKPQIEYSIELWAEQVTDFVKTLGTENVAWHQLARRPSRFGIFQASKFNLHNLNPVEASNLRGTAAPGSISLHLAQIPGVASCNQRLVVL
eukprot:symbB.v1.2.034447.t1/scaffold4442.1/size39597/1